MRAHGHLPEEERRALAADALARVVIPAARALLAGAGAGPAASAAAPRC